MALTDSIVKPLRKVLPGFRDIRQTASPHVALESRHRGERFGCRARV